MIEENLTSVDAEQSDNLSQESPAGEVTQPEVSLSPQPDDMLTKEQVNNLIVEAKRKAYNKGIESARSQAQQSEPQQTQPVPEQQQQAPQDINEAIDKRVAELAQQQQAQAEIDKCVGRISEIAERGKQSIDGFVESMKRVEGFKNALNLLRTAADVDNAEHVLHYLAENAAVIPGLDALATNMPGVAKAELDKISARLKQNQDAKTKPQAPAPLSRVNPENDRRGGIGSSGKSESELSVNEMMDYLRS